jgi:hypothetical protein
LDEALKALRSRARELAETAPRRTVDAKIRRFDPVQQVVARLELAGPQRFSPSVQAGLDVRRAGSPEPFQGRSRRRVITPRRGEDSYAALGRAVRDRVD